MTAETKNKTAASTVKKRGKRIGPSNVEAKRAAALRQAAASAEQERRSQGIASTLSFFEILRDATITGTIPSNAQLTSTLNSWISSPAMHTSDLSPSGKALVDDMKGLFELINEFLKTHNADELLQKFLHHVHLASRVAGADILIAGWRARGRQRRLKAGNIAIGGKGKISLWRSKNQELFVGGEHSVISGIDPETSRQPATRQAGEAGETSEEKMRKKIGKDVRALLRIGQQLLISTDFRDLLVKIQKIGKRIFEVSQHEGESEAAKESVGRAGEEWQERRRTSLEVVENELSEIEHEEAETDRKLNRTLSGQEPEEANEPQTYNFTRIEEETMPTPLTRFETARSLPIVETVQDEKESIRVEEQQQQQPRKPTTSFTPSERHAEILNDMKDVFQHLKDNKAFSRTLRDLYSVLLKLKSSKSTLKSNVTANISPDDPALKLIESDLRYDANFRAAQEELLVLLERIANNTSLSPLIDNLRKIREETGQDYELRDFFGDWRAFLKRCTAPGFDYLKNDEYMRRGEFLLIRTEKYFAPENQYRTHIDEAYDNLNQFVEGLKKDQLTRKLGKQVGTILKQDLIGLSRGQRISLRSILSSSALIRPDLLDDFRYHILPRILKSIHSIPLPRIEIVSGGTLLILEDLIIPADALVPMQLEILTSSHVTVNPRSRLFHRTASQQANTVKRAEGVQGAVQLKMSSIAGQVRNVRFTLDRSEGWPQFSDQGLADLRIYGKNGLSILVDLASHPASEMTGRTDLKSSLIPAALIAHRVRVKIDRLSLSLHDSLHDSMYRMLSPLLSSVIKRNIERSIRDQILTVVDSIDGLFERLSRSVVSK